MKDWQHSIDENVFYGFIPCVDATLQGKPVLGDGGKPVLEGIHLVFLPLARAALAYDDADDFTAVWQGSLVPNLSDVFSLVHQRTGVRAETREDFERIVETECPGILATYNRESQRHGELARSLPFGIFRPHVPEALLPAFWAWAHQNQDIIAAMYDAPDCDRL